MEDFTKQIPFPSMKNESMLVNPGNPTMLYSVTSCDIDNDTKFRAFVYADKLPAYEDILTAKYGEDYLEASDDEPSVIELSVSEDEEEPVPAPSKSQMTEDSKAASEMATSKDHTSKDLTSREQTSNHPTSREEDSEESDPDLKGSGSEYSDKSEDSSSEEASEASENSEEPTDSEAQESKTLTTQEPQRQGPKRRFIIRRHQVEDQFEYVKKARLEQVIPE